MKEVYLEAVSGVCRPSDPGGTLRALGCQPWVHNERFCIVTTFTEQDRIYPLHFSQIAYLWLFFLLAASPGSPVCRPCVCATFPSSNLVIISKMLSVRWPPGRLSCEGAQAPCFSSSLRKDNAWRRKDWNWKAILESRAVIFVFGVQTVNHKYDNNSPLDHWVIIVFLWQQAQTSCLKKIIWTLNIMNLIACRL